MPLAPEITPAEIIGEEDDDIRRGDGRCSEDEEEGKEETNHGREWFVESRW
jgi:hypothetical protein